MANVIICLDAEIEYTESLIWYSARSESAATAFDAEFNQAISEIESDPQRYPFCDERHQFYLMCRFPFRIIYRVTDDTILVVAVAHGSREPNYWTDR